MRHYRMVIPALLLAWVLAGCTLSGGSVEEVIPQISGEPLARITAPLPNATYLEGVGVNIQLAVSNAGAGIDRVEVSLDGVVAATLPDPNPSDAPAFGVTQTFSAEGVGSHVVEARVFREDGTVSLPVSVTYNVVSDLPSAPTPTPTNTIPPTPTSAQTVILTALPLQTTDTAQTTVTPGGVVVVSTNPVATPLATSAGVTPSGVATSTTPLAKFEGAVNVRRGPSTNFEPPIGTFNAGQSAEALALNTDGKWLKVRFSGGEGWVFLEIIKTEGAIDSLPREAGPAVPTRAPATATSAFTAVPAGTSVPATTVPSTGGPNLIVVGFELQQIAGGKPINDITINEPSTAFVRVRNVGDQPSIGFFAVLTIVNTSDGGFKLVEAGAVSGLAAGAETLVQIAFTDKAGQTMAKTAVVRVDENNQVLETNENDNASAPINYTLK